MPPSALAFPPTPPQADRHNPARRDLFRNIGRLTALAAAWSAADAQRAKAAPPAASADVDPSGLLAKLLRRCTYGPTPDDLGQAASLGYSAWLESQLNPSGIDDSVCDSLLLPLTTQVMTPEQLYLADADRPAATLVISDMSDSALIRAIFSKRQLSERMVEFWNDHFNIDISGDDLGYLRSLDDRTVARAHALGTFRELLYASAQSPAMMLYLNNNVSVAGNPNENYARELMELHTLGVNGGYTQQDVHEVARCFTGWTFYNSTLTNGPLAGSFRYNATRHDTASKTVLGHVIPARAADAGIQDGYDVLDILAAHPSTARFVSTKLVRWLLGEGASASVVDAVTATFTATNGDVKAMIRTALAPGYLYDAPPRYKRPFHLIVSALRVLPPVITAYAGLRNQLLTMGHRTFAWQPPDGYPDSTAYWSGLLLPRLSFGALLMNAVNGSITGANVNDLLFTAGLSTADQIADRINQGMFLGELTTVERNRIRDYMLPNNPTQTRIREAIGLAIGAPSFQLY